MTAKRTKNKLKQETSKAATVVHLIAHMLNPHMKQFGTWALTCSITLSSNFPSKGAKVL